MDFDGDVHGDGDGDGDDAHVHRRARGNRDGRAHVNGYARLREYVRVSGDALRLSYNRNLCTLSKSSRFCG